MGYYTDEAREARLEARAERMEAEAARVGLGLDAPYTALNPDELQPCGHPVQAISGSKDGHLEGDFCTQWCGWCEEVGQLQAEVARLREALDILLSFRIDQTFDAHGTYTLEKAQEWDRIVEGVHLSIPNAHLGDPCIYCGTPHDDVVPGSCRVAALSDAAEQESTE